MVGFVTRIVFTVTLLNTVLSIVQHLDDVLRMIEIKLKAKIIFQNMQSPILVNGANELPSF